MHPVTLVPGTIQNTNTVVIHLINLPLFGNLPFHPDGILTRVYCQKDLIRDQMFTVNAPGIIQSHREVKLNKENTPLCKI